ncbi:MAG: hypothetical protein Q2484_15645, partial [Candidatus Sedimenticola sp. (ex Thyasira tokunagai)]
PLTGRRVRMPTLLPLWRAARTTGKQCGLTATGDYQPSLRSPWLAAKEIIHTLSEALLKAYTNALRELVVKKGEKLKETPDLVINKAKYKAELIPPALIVQRFFAEEQSALDALQATLDTATQELEAYIEEHAVEGGLLEEALTDNGKVNKGGVTARLKQASDVEEIAALKQVKKRIDAEANQKKQLKTAQEALEKKVFLQYPKLTEADNKALIVGDKWLATLQGNIVAEIERVTQQLANRVKTLEERYETPLPELTAEVATLSTKVDEHLRKMGLVW